MTFDDHNRCAEGLHLAARACWDAAWVVLFLGVVFALRGLAHALPLVACFLGLHGAIELMLWWARWHIRQMRREVDELKRKREASE